MSNMEVNKVIAWCSETDVQLENALILSNVPSDCDDMIVYKVLDKVPGMCKCKVRGRRSDPGEQQHFVLIETARKVSEIPIPAEIGGSDVGAWYTQIVNVTTQTPEQNRGDEFQTKLFSFLEKEGKSLADVQSMVSPSLSLSTELVGAINSLVQKCNVATPAEGPSYRKLRTFSGVTPTPSGEDEYEAWAEQTTHILEEWRCSDNIKKQRLVECLRGPAADIVRFEKVANPTASSGDYLSALETAFGTTESAADLMVRFRSTFQNEGEKLSAYILRLDKLLHSVLRKRGINLSEMNQLRMQQIIRGALPTDMVALRFRMTHKLCNPLSFTDLLKEVREEENMMHSRTSVQANVALSAASSVKSETSVKTNPTESEVERLKKEVRVLKSEMSRLLTATTETVTHGSSESHSLATGERRSTNRARGSISYFCYRCGEEGHLKRDCVNEENLRKVNERLIKLKRQSGNFPGAR
ncbi:paraneoplastic antigen Ma1 homolog [Tachysurus vachellii]|uniref:paraneoplastic antigen Ma1 homolog n=1 Tax=Tachysurus vachellii TaxID=175792 RepID=UPI00296AF0DB|nr:paraneoplastic antigen Ma1 homolog [Tachysurus vachellii]